MHHVPHTEHMDGSIGRNGEAQSTLDKEGGNISIGVLGHALPEKLFSLYLDI